MKTELTQEQKRIKIAEACPFVEKYGKGELLWEWQGRKIYFDPFNDLNSMRDAEKSICNQFSLREEAYWRNLEYVKPHPIYATAAQRAEAFGKTLGLW